MTSTSTSTACPICDEPWQARGERAAVTCAFCSVAACRGCCASYLLTQPDARCMQPACAKPWTRGFLVAHFSHSFLSKTYRDHKQRIYYERELSLLPASQEVMEHRKEVQRLQDLYHDHKHSVQRLNKRMREEIVATHLVYQLCDTKVMTDEEREQMVVMLHRIQQEQRQTRTQLTQARTMQEHYAVLLQNTDKASGAAPKRFQRRCANAAACRGFVGVDWLCGLCETRTCRHCHEIDADGHACDPDQVATARLLATDTKPCPQCSTPIFKVDGCDQMWCTQCHVAFSWRTGSVETRVHNPHYYEWLRQQHGGVAPREALDAPCGRELDTRFARTLYQGVRTKQRIPATEFVMQKLDDILSTTIHVREVELPRYREDRVLNNEELRIAFLAGELTEERFRQRVHQQHTKHAKHKDIYDVLSMFVQSVTDILYRLHHLAEQEPHRTRCQMMQMYLGQEIQGYTAFVETMHELLAEVDALLVYTNQCLLEVSRTYQSVQLVLYLRSQQPMILVSMERLAAEETRKKAKRETTQPVTEVIDLIE